MFPNTPHERLTWVFTIPLCFFLVNVKWGKEKFDAVELNTEEPPMVFKAQLFALTGVQPDRQKVMVKGGTLKVLIATTLIWLL